MLFCGSQIRLGFQNFSCIKRKKVVAVTAMNSVGRGQRVCSWSRDHGGLTGNVKVQGLHWNENRVIHPLYSSSGKQNLLPERP